MPNPFLFDGRLALIYWTPRSVPETSIEQLADSIRSRAPNVNAVLVKTSNGIGWQGAHDSSKPNLAINSVADVQRWTRALESRGLECHAWHVARGSVPLQEADRIAGICREGGVRSMLLDLEPGDFYFVGDRSAAQALAAGLRDRVGPEFHLGLILDYRSNRPAQLWVQDVWFPEIDSLHPMVYHYHFGTSAEQALAHCYAAIGRWGKPVYPMLQAYTPDGFAPYPAGDVVAAAQAATRNHRAAGLTFYRYGHGLRTPDSGLGPEELGEMARVTLPDRVVVGPPPVPPPPVVLPPPPAPGPGAPQLVVVDPNNERTGEFTVNYYGNSAVLSADWAVSLDAHGRPYAFRPAAFNAQTLYISYVPRLAGKGAYHVEAFIPREHATAPDTRYVVVDYPGGRRREVTVLVNQGTFADEWVPLQGVIVDGQVTGEAVRVFELDPAFPDAGRVNVADTTTVDPATTAAGRFEVAFGALRWRPVNPAPLAAQTSLDSPVGTEAERAGPFATGGRLGSYSVWVGRWFDANPIGSRYMLSNGPAIHTGADLNLDGGVLADKDAPVHAMGDGLVIWARFLSPGWKNVIVIEHPVPGSERVVYARYAHLADLRVREGERVVRGQHIAGIGEYAPNNYHLHFDISADTILKRLPGHWPGDDAVAVRTFYADPLAFIRRYHVVR